MSLKSILVSMPVCLCGNGTCVIILYKLYLVPAFTSAMSVAAGTRFSLALTDTGDLYAFGLKDAGQLVQHTDIVDDERQHVRPLLVNRRHYLANQQIEMVSAGNEHAACVTTNGSVYTWGCADYGQMGIGEEEDDAADEQYVSHCLSSTSFGNRPARMVACGDNFTVVLTVTGLVWTCGFGGNGEIGRGVVNLQTEVDHCCLVLRQIDTGSFQDTPVDFVAAGGDHAMALQEGCGVLWAWGCNQTGELGLGDNFDDIDAVHVPTRVSIAPVVFMKVKINEN